MRRNDNEADVVVIPSLVCKHAAIYFPPDWARWYWHCYDWTDPQSFLGGEVSRVRKNNHFRNNSLTQSPRNLRTSTRTSSSLCVEIKWSPDSKFSLARHEKRSPFSCPSFPSRRGIIFPFVVSDANKDRQPGQITSIQRKTSPLSKRAICRISVKKKPPKTCI